MYSVFEANGHKLPSINTQATPSKIQEWKSKPEVKKCYNNLFKKVKDGQPTTYMSLIIEKLRKENKGPSKTQIAYAIGVCETYLNPNNQNIQMSESIMKSKIFNNLVSFLIYNSQNVNYSNYGLFIYLFILAKIGE
jgi:hypothetical protein